MHINFLREKGLKFMVWVGNVCFCGGKNTSVQGPIKGVQKLGIYTEKIMVGIKLEVLCVTRTNIV